VARAVGALLRRSDGAASELEKEIDVTDAGSRFTVRVRGRTREYLDAARDCKERTRTAAVFVALTLAPPEIDSLSDPAARSGSAKGGATSAAASGTATPSTATPSTATPKMATPNDSGGASARGDATAPESSRSDAPAATRPKAKPKPPTPPQRASSSAASASSPSSVASPTDVGNPKRRNADASRLALELGLLGALAPRDDATLLVAGAELRGAFTVGSLGLSLGLNLPSPSTLELSGARVKQERFAADASFRLLWRGGALSGAFDLGLLTAVSRLSRDGAGSVEGKRRLDLGLRAAASVEPLDAAVSPFFRVFAEVLPVTRKIALEPRGVVGETSLLWLGASLGISGKFR
jgi:hypothetical protein